MHKKCKRAKISSSLYPTIMYSKNSWPPASGNRFLVEKWTRWRRTETSKDFFSGVVRSIDPSSHARILFMGPVCRTMTPGSRHRMRRTDGKCRSDALKKYLRAFYAPFLGNLMNMFFSFLIHIFGASLRRVSLRRGKAGFVPKVTDASLPCLI